jgi:enoyl-CoA hydratase/carnithine racemase
MEIRLTRHSAHVAVITLDNQARLNAMTRAMMADLGRLWDELGRDDTRCIVVTGAGERAFSAGADLSGDLSARVEMAKVIGHALLKSDVST